MTRSQRIGLGLALALFLGVAPALAAESPDSGTTNAPAATTNAPAQGLTPQPGGQPAPATAASRREVPHAGKLPATPREWNYRPSSCD